MSVLAIAASAVLAFPARRVDYALDWWASTTGIQLLYLHDEIGHCASPAVRYHTDPLHMLRQILRWVPGAQARVLNPHTVTITGGRCPNYCIPELGAHAPLPPCEPRPLDVYSREST